MKEKIIVFVFFVCLLVGLIVACSSFRFKSSDTEIVVEKVQERLL